MVFSSGIFLLVFLPLFLLGYHLCPAKFRNYLILLFSIVFYAWGAPVFVFVILGSTILDFHIVKALHTSEVIKRRKTLLGFSIFMNLGLLMYFKYANFFVENVNFALEQMGVSSLEWTSVLLPIGISFYTFQTLTYSIDVYRKAHAPLEKVGDYLLYIMSFPQMIAGPIVRYTEIADQITGRKYDANDTFLGFVRFCIGLGKKVLIANVMAEQADFVFGLDYHELSVRAAWAGIAAYTFQIYFDFSGYSDMAIGLGRMMGFRFPENFNSPYTSRSISEFWRRWHITLGSFMRNYLYIPLGGNRVSAKWRVYFNLVVVFLLSGLWHGASWNFVLWGVFHGIFLILDRLFLEKLLHKVGRIPATLFTFVVVMLGWVLFRIEDFDSALLYYGALINLGGDFTFVWPTNYSVLIYPAIFFAFFNAIPGSDKVVRFIYHKNEYSLPWKMALLGFSVVLFFLTTGSIISSGFNPFIYFRF